MQSANSTFSSCEVWCTHTHSDTVVILWVNIIVWVFFPPQKWLNPLSVSESFFTVQPIDQISPVEVCEDFDVVPSTSPSSSSTSALIHSQNSGTSGIVNNSASSSVFSNRSYFNSSSSGGLACIDPTPAYFTYHDDFHPSLCPSLWGFPTYESLKREPHSPDSGFGIELEADNEEERYMEGGGQFLLDDHNIPFLILPVRFPPHTCPAISPPTPPSLLVEPQMSSDSHQEDAPMTAASDDSSSAWLVPGAMCRSSSMPVEPGKTGYLTLKELQATFSNKSIWKVEIRVSVRAIKASSVYTTNKV